MIMLHRYTLQGQQEPLAPPPPPPPPPPQPDCLAEQSMPDHAPTKPDTHVPVSCGAVALCINTCVSPEGGGQGTG